MDKAEHFPHFRYRLKVSDRAVAGFMEISDPQKGERILPGGEKSGDPSSPHTRREYRRFTMKWGLIYDAEFEVWTSSVGDGGAPATDIRVEVLDERGKTAGSFALDGCRPAGIASVPKNNANANMMAVEALVLACEGSHPGDGER